MKGRALGTIGSESAIRQAETVATVKQMIRDEETSRRQNGWRPLDEILARQFGGGLRHIDLYGYDRQRNEELAYGLFNFLATVLTPADTDVHQKAVRYCRENGYLKAMGESTNPGGGALVPAEFDRAVIRLIERNGVLRRNARVRLMTRDLRSIPRRTGGVTVGWIVEGGSITGSQPAYDSVNLAAKKLAALTVASSELLEDAAIAIADELAFEIGAAFAIAEDRAGFIGDGSPTYGNITGITTKLKGLSGTIANIAGLKVATGNTFAEFVLQDFLDAAALLPDYADTPNTAWYVHRSFFFGTMLRVALVGATNLAVGGIVTTGADGRPIFLGYPVNFTTAMPKADANSQIAALVGDLSLACTLGDRRQRTLFTDPYTLSGSDSIQVRGIERVDLVASDVGNASAVAADRVAGPIVGLISAAS